MFEYESGFFTSFNIKDTIMLFIKFRFSIIFIDYYFIKLIVIALYLNTANNKCDYPLKTDFVSTYGFVSLPHAGQ